jgi:hypothetical protein
VVGISQGACTAKAGSSSRHPPPREKRAKAPSCLPDVPRRLGRQDFKTLIELEPSSSDYKKNFAETYKGQGLLQEALAAFFKLLEEHPERVCVCV